MHTIKEQDHISCCNLALSVPAWDSRVAYRQSEHQVNFSTAAAAQQRLMEDRYAEAIGGGGLIADPYPSFKAWP